MTAAASLPPWGALIVAALVLLGAGITLVGALGLLRFESFYERVHAPTLGASLGTIATAAASILFFSLAQTRLVVHEVLIVLFVTLTTPVTLMMLTRAAHYRDRLEGEVTAETEETRPVADRDA